MNVMVTGAFGNIGRYLVQELHDRGHEVRCFDLRTPANRRVASRLPSQVEVIWGDLRNPPSLSAAAGDQDVVVHLAFVIPKLSATGVGSEERPDWARTINVGGTLNLLAALKSLKRPPKILFASSFHVFGMTQERQPPRLVDDPVQPAEHYSLHKVACEEMVKASGLQWAIFRLAAAMPVRLILDSGMFDVPLANRIEFVHPRDVAVAIANGLQRAPLWGKTWLIGGGPRCQVRYGEVVQKVLEATGVGMLPAEAFGTEPFATDWLDTSASQDLLNYQRRTLGDYVSDLQLVMGGRKHLVRLFRPLIRHWLLGQSPYYRGSMA